MHHGAAHSRPGPCRASGASPPDQPGAAAVDAVDADLVRDLLAKVHTVLHTDEEERPGWIDACLALEEAANEVKAAMGEGPLEVVDAEIVDDELPPPETRLFDVILAAVETPASADDVTANGVLAELDRHRPLVREWLGDAQPLTESQEEALERRYAALVEIAYWFGPGNNQARVIACRALGCDPNERHSFDDATAPVANAVEVDRDDLRMALDALDRWPDDAPHAAVARLRDRLPKLCAADGPTMEVGGPAGFQMKLLCNKPPHPDTEEHRSHGRAEGNYPMGWEVSWR